MGIMDDIGSIGSAAGALAAPFTGGLSLAPSLIAGGASLLGNIFSSDQSAKNIQQQIAAQQAMQTQSEQFNASQAGLNRDFQAGQASQQEQFQTNMLGAQEQYNTQMSNTAYTRAVANMKRAGLNPMMMFGSGGPASSPSISAPSGSSAGGSAASVGTPSVPLSGRMSALGNLGGAVGSAMDALTKFQQLRESQADVSVREKQASLLASQKFNVELQNQKLQGSPGAGPTEAGTAENEIAKARATDAKNVALQAQHEYDARNNPEGAIADGQRVYSNAVKNVGDAIVPWVNSATAFRSFLPKKSTVESVDSTGRSTFSQRYEGGAFGGLGYKPLDW